MLPQIYKVINYFFATVLIIPGVAVADVSTINLTGQVPSVLYVNVEPLPVSANLPTDSPQSFLKIADYVVRSNHVQSSISVSCQSSPLDNTSCFLKRTGSTIEPSVREKIGYTFSLDQVLFYGITDYQGGAYISYNPDHKNLIPGSYSDTITISITFSE